MSIRISSIPYAVVFMASLFPWLAAYFDSKLVALTPDMALIVLFGLLTAVAGVRIRRMHWAFEALLAVIVVHSIIALADGRGIGSGGLVLLAAEIFVFYQLLSHGGEGVTERKVHRWVTRLYQLHLGFLVIELALILAGQLDALVAIAGHATEVAMYKTYNSAALLNYFGMKGLNSLLLGSQTASQLALFAMFWFLPYFKRPPAYFRGPAMLLWFVAALVMYPLVATMTANVLLVMFAFLLLFVFKETTFSGLGGKGVIFLVVALFAGEIYRMLSFRINNPADVQIYLHAFTHLVENQMGMTTYKQMLGWGSNMAASPISDANFGLGMLLFQVGFVFFSAFSLFFLFAYWSLRAVVKRARKYPQDLRAVSLLAVMNGILAMGWLASLIHYTPAVELGGRHMFALHVALTLFLIARIRHATSPLRKGEGCAPGGVSTRGAVQP